MAINKHLGSTLDSFLEGEVILEEATARTQKKALAYQLAEAMKAQQIGNGAAHENKPQPNR